MTTTTPGCKWKCALIVIVSFILVLYFQSHHFVKNGNQEIEMRDGFHRRKTDSGDYDPSSLHPGNNPSILTQLYASKGSPLPNYFTKHKAGGLQPEDYTGGITVFLHHNKAAGTTVKKCLSLMQQNGLIEGSSPMVVTSNNRVKLDSEAQKGVLLQHYNDTKYFMGGHSFGMCDYYKSEKSCSYFTFMRDPIDRVISSYFYCQKRPQDQLCGPDGVEKFTPVEWAIYQGSYFFYQLFMHPAYCKGFNLSQRGKTNFGDEFISKNFQKYVKNWDFVLQCWFRQRKYFEKVVSNMELNDLFDYAINNLENWFAVIGLTEDFSLSLKMLSHVYKIPLDERCDHKTYNKGAYKTGNDLDEYSNSSITKSKMRTLLLNSPDAMAALKYDIALYNRGKEIFEKQKEVYYRRNLK